ncbi:MAG TPA: AI-2E family transporter [Acidimicrobiales bacterium]|nr:AI-2E family transporter [Acidimicrobiales bacterium]
MTNDRGRSGGSAPRVHPAIDRLAAYAWRFVVLAAAGWGLLWLLQALRLVVFPVIAALFLTVALTVPARALRRHGWPPLLATWAVFLGFLGVVVAAVALVVPAFAEEFSRLPPTLDDGFERVKTWLADDSPVPVDRARLDELQSQFGDVLRGSVASPGGFVLRGAVLVVELLAGLLLALVLAFFFVKDGERFQRAAMAALPEERRPLAGRLAGRAWQTLGGYLRGAAMLGAVEAAIMAVTLALVSGGLILPVVVLTFAAAFVPFVGAAVAGITAVLVTLVTAGFVPALIVAGVALAVQQLDNDLLAPIVYGRALNLHPVVILLAVAGGASVGGFVGAFLAVPVTATVVNVASEAREPTES